MPEVLPMSVLGAMAFIGGLFAVVVCLALGVAIGVIGVWKLLSGWFLGEM